MNNVLAIGVSNRDYFNIMMSYYPKHITENFNVVLFVDNQHNILDDIKDLIKFHNIPVFNRASIVINSDLVADYTKDHTLSDNAGRVLTDHGLFFKIIAPIYIKKIWGATRVFFVDDDIFILRDLSPLFDKYDGWAFKKENLFGLKNSDRHEMIKQFNFIFSEDFTLSELNAISLNSGTIMYDVDDDYITHVNKFLENTFMQNISFNVVGFTSWTLEQRFQHFNMHYLMKKQANVKLLDGTDIRLITNSGKEEVGTTYLKQSTPYIIHYAVGKKKPLWLSKFLIGIAWKFNDFIVQPKFELRNILYNKDWIPSQTKRLHTKKKEHIKPIF